MVAASAPGETSARRSAKRWLTSDTTLLAADVLSAGGDTDTVDGDEDDDAGIAGTLTLDDVELVGDCPIVLALASTKALGAA